MVRIAVGRMERGAEADERTKKSEKIQQKQNPQNIVHDIIFNVLYICMYSNLILKIQWVLWQKDS